MDIKLWYSKHTKQWRWTLMGFSKQESGQRPDLRDAMNDVASTIEWMIEDNENEEVIE